ncbi:MAG: type II toxin-antitoxin system VapC family toxin [Micropepsaceae bacterium]
MNVYPDASFLISLFTLDSLTVRAREFLRAKKPDFTVSDFAAAEFVSAIARRVRVQELSKDDAKQVFSTFDEWVAKFSQRVGIERADVAAADGYIRRLDLTLRTPDALHIAMTQRLGIPLVTFDEKMEIAARQLGTEIERA